MPSPRPPRAVLFDEQNMGDVGTDAIYMRTMDGSPAVRLGDGQSLALTPDGKRVLARSRAAGALDLVLLPIGAGEPRTLPRPGLDLTAGIFFPDGRRLLLSGHEPGRASQKRETTYASMKTGFWNKSMPMNRGTVCVRM